MSMRRTDDYLTDAEREALNERLKRQAKNTEVILRGNREAFRRAIREKTDER